MGMNTDAWDTWRRAGVFNAGRGGWGGGMGHRRCHWKLGSVAVTGRVKNPIEKHTLLTPRLGRSYRVLQKYIAGRA